MEKYVYLLIVLVFLFLLINWNLVARRKKNLEGYEISQSLKNKMKIKYPYLNNNEINMVISAFKDYFYIKHIVGNLYIPMPSLVVADLWYEFSLDSNEYQKFCMKSLGKKTRPLKAEGLSILEGERTGIYVVWDNACRLEGINPDKPRKIPRLFRLDYAFNIQNGFYYIMDCKKVRKGLNEYCIDEILHVKVEEPNMWLSGESFTH